MKIETEHYLDNFDSLTLIGNNLDLSLTTCGKEGLTLQLHEPSYNDIIFDDFTLEQSLKMRNFLIKAYPLSLKSYLLSQLDRLLFKKWF